MVDTTGGSYARRVTLGLDGGRLAMLLAVMNRHAGVATHDMDVFVNVVGGLKVSETATDLAVIAAVCSSLRDRIIDSATVVFGEVGLSGELRPVANGEARLKAAKQHGFKRVIVPQANAPHAKIAGLSVQAVATVDEALQLLFD